MIINMVVRYTLSSLPPEFKDVPLFIVNKKVLFFFIIYKIYILCGQVTLKKGFGEDLYGVKKYQD